jgi:hypothetical protein
MHFLAVGLAALALSGAGAAESNVAGCSRVIAGHASAGWRSESVVAGPVGVPRRPLRQMSATANGELVTKMPILVEGHSPVTVSVPPGLRSRVHLYYGRVLDRNGDPTTSFNGARGYGETKFRPCADRPRTIWPGGVRIRGTAPVRLLVSSQTSAAVIPLRLGRPGVYKPN